MLNGLGDYNNDDQQNYEGLIGDSSNGAASHRRSTYRRPLVFTNLGMSDGAIAESW
jgi:hypothetical protein